MAIFVAVKRDDLGHTLAAAVLLAIAIVSHHFTAMGALVFVPDPTRIIDTVSLSPAALSTVVAGIAAIILGMCLVAALSDRRSKDELRKQKSLLNTAIENMSQGLCMFDADGRIVLFNECYSKMMGMPAASLQDRSLLDLFKHKKASGEFTGDPEDIPPSVRVFDTTRRENQIGQKRSQVAVRHAAEPLRRSPVCAGRFGRRGVCGAQCA
ncbi:MAG: PAS-domain containing protein [Alphaproteobacteria bacterium]|nr:PAS-domain containing protein [Alphaproteobacteria bacterium]